MRVCHNLMQNYLLKLSIHKCFYSIYCVSKNQIFSLFFPTARMAANYAEDCGAGKLVAGYQQVLFVQFV